VIGLAIQWQKPLDGAEVVFGEDEHSKEGVLRARSDRFAAIALEVSDFEAPVCILFVNSLGHEGLVAFATRFGVPSLGIPAEGDPPYSGALMPLVEALRDDVEDVLFGNFADIDHVQSINKIIKNAGIQPQFDYVEGRYRFVLRPRTLSDFLLIEASMARDAGATARNCAHCGKAFLTGPMTGRRSTAKYCMDRCRVAAMRLRKDKKG
tara:strand:+ start:526 stop:1149 length:624 start_codon:yes stop_codon:yes gene_type:complete